jgi:hypothetical protein
MNLNMLIYSHAFNQVCLQSEPKSHMLALITVSLDCYGMRWRVSDLGLQALR